MKPFFEELKSCVSGELFFDDASRRIYSVDASILEKRPLCIVQPKTVEALEEALRIAQKHKVSVTARGAATGIAGGCLGSGMIVDTSRYLNRILEINLKERFCRVEPGVVQDHLNAALKPHGMRLGPNTSTGNRSTIGGMLATNAAGSHSLYFGQMRDHLQKVKFAGAKEFSSLPIAEWKKSADPLLQKLYALREEKRAVIEKLFPKIKRRASGYNIDALLADELFNPCVLIAGSEGTLGIATEIQLQIVPLLDPGVLHLLFFSDMQEAMEAVSTLLELQPRALEMIDRKILEGGKASRTLKERLSWLKGDPACILALELPAKKEIDLPGCYALTTPENPDDFWAVRKAGLELLLAKRKWQRALAFIEDLALPARALPEFMQQFSALLKKYDKEAGIYGHVGESCLHIRPYIEITEEKETLITLMQESAELIKRLGGVLSGEHGDGILRSWQNSHFFGAEIQQIFEEVKEIFDPEGLYNPGKIVHPEPLEAHFKLPHRFDRNAFQNFSSEGGFALAADLCNGNGLCRKKEGLMCPSFQASGDEQDSTRARAQLLRQLPLNHPDIEAILKRCLACKGCKKECPSEVDVAKMKQEALYHYHKTHGVPLRTRILANLALSTKVFSRFPFLQKIARLLSPFLGIARPPPLLAKARLSALYQPKKKGKEIVLLNDTFSEFYSPEIGLSALRVLQAIGYNVQLPPWSCCGRPLLSKGFLPEAKNALLKLVETLHPYTSRGIEVVGLEPSCLLTLREEAEALGVPLPDRTLFLTFDELLAREKERFPFSTQPHKITLHGHCHQKAHVGNDPTLTFLRSHPSATVDVIDTSCCGMAGSFGYERENYPLSKEIAHLTLIPHLEKIDEETLVVASGFSCRTQIRDFSERRALHLAEAAERLMAQCIKQ